MARHRHDPEGACVTIDQAPMGAHHHLLGSSRFRLPVEMLLVSFVLVVLGLGLGLVLDSIGQRR